MKRKIIYGLLFITALSVFAEKVTLIFENLSETIDVGEELLIGYGSKVSEVKFENQNPKIKKMIFKGPHFLKDYSFVTNCKELEIFIMDEISIDNLNFLEGCKNLKILSLDGVFLKQLPNLRELKNLEYLGMTNCYLTNVDELTKHAEKLRCINLSFNRITKLPKVNTNNKTLYLFSSEDVIEKLPKEFLQYTR